MFTQTDPIGIAGGLNTYGYANGDPINFSDPFGLMPSGPPDWEKAFRFAVALLGSFNKAAPPDIQTANPAFETAAQSQTTSQTRPTTSSQTGRAFTGEARNLPVTREPGGQGAITGPQNRAHFNRGIMRNGVRIGGGAVGLAISFAVSPTPTAAGDVPPFCVRNPDACRMPSYGPSPVG